MDESSVDKHLAAMIDAEVIAVDTETTGLNVKDGRDYLMGVSCAYRLGPLGIVSAYFPFRHEFENLDRSVVDRLASVLAVKPLVFHNLKFDLHSLATIGIVLDPTARLYDTLNIAHMVNEELPSKGLDFLAKKFLKEGGKTDEVKKWASVFGWSTVPVGLMEPYACRDAELTLELFEILWRNMKEQELDSLWPIERRFTRLLTDMERRGVRVNRDYAHSMSVMGRARMDAIERELGFKPSSPLALGNFLLVELRLPVYKRTPEGKSCFDKAAMELYEVDLSRMDRKEAQLVLEYRGWQKAVTSLYEPLLELVSPDGRVRPNFKQHGTRTGRLSCAEPNLQQIPRSSDKAWNGTAKRSFDADEGFGLYGYDYSQLEFRLAAAYGQEQWMREVFDDASRDIFTELAERIGESRQVTKTYVYANTYGAGLTKIASTLGKTESECRDSFETFKNSIPGIRNASGVATKRAKERGYVRYWTGRRRHFPFSEGHHKAFNSILQGGGAELVKRAMVAIDDDTRIDKDECRIVLQVHDEIVFEIKDGCREKYEPLIVQHMTNFPEFGITLKVEGKVWNK